MHLWDELDRGVLNEKQAYEQAEQAARRRVAGGAKAQTEEAEKAL